MIVRRFAPAATAVATLLGSTAVAEVTASQVWEEMKAQIDIYGEGVTIGNEDVSGGTVTISDIVVDVSDDYDAIMVTVPQIVFAEQGDGTVAITLSDDIPFSFDSSSYDWENDTFEPTTYEGAVRHSGLSMIVSGTPEEMTYDYSADRYAVELDGATYKGAPFDVAGLFAMNDLAGTYVLTPGEVRSMSYDITAGGLDISFSADDPEAGIDFTFSGQIADLAVAAAVQFQEAILESGYDGEGFDPSTLLADISYTFGNLAYVFDFAEDGMEADGQMTADGGAFTFAFDTDEVVYDAATQNVALDMTTNAVPFPVNATLAEYGLSLRAPLSVTDEPAPFDFAFNVTEFAVNDEVWQMGDPGGMFPREPLTVELALSGTATWLYDIFDMSPENQMALNDSDMPLQPDSISIDTLNVDALGVTATGDGAFTFDATDTVTVPGVPRPEGQANVEVTGLNALLDDLVAMGLVPEDQMMGARMMMGLFATSTGDDQLTSNVEINAQGHVIVNGQRIQ